MIATDSLISAYEVVEFSADALEGDVSLKRNFIINKEEQLFNEKFGNDFYLDLLSDKIDYSNVSEYEEYKEYEEGDIVKLYSLYYVALRQTSSNVNSKDWREAPKFNNESYNFIWFRYMRQIIALEVSYSTSTYSAIRLTARGIERNKRQDANPANLKEIAALRKKSRVDIDGVIKNMNAYIFRNPSDFGLYKPLKDKCSSSRLNRRLHFGFNTGGSRFAEIQTPQLPRTFTRLANLPQIFTHISYDVSQNGNILTVNRGYNNGSIHVYRDTGGIFTLMNRGSEYEINTNGISSFDIVFSAQYKGFVLFTVIEN